MEKGNGVVVFVDFPLLFSGPTRRIVCLTESEFWNFEISGSESSGLRSHWPGSLLSQSISRLPQEHMSLTEVR